MTTMLDKCAVAGDITQAIDRRGAWTVAVTIIGGTESTAVKLQSAETADGEFTDFKTLIASADASAEQYKGFVVDLHGAKQFIKVTGATMATAVLGDCDHDLKKVAVKAGEIPSGADLEDNKTATIDVSTYTEPVEITPTAGKDGMKKATVTLSNIPSGSSKLYAWGGDVAGDKVFYSTVGDLSSVNDNAQFSISEDSPLGLALCQSNSVPSDPNYYHKMGFDSIEWVTSDWDDYWMDDIAVKVSDTSFYFRHDGENYALMTRVSSLDIDLAQALPRVVHN